MDKNARLQLKQEIQVFMTKYPNAKTSEVKKFVFSGVGGAATRIPTFLNPIPSRIGRCAAGGGRSGRLAGSRRQRSQKSSKIAVFADFRRAGAARPSGRPAWDTCPWIAQAMGHLCYFAKFFSPFFFWTGRPSKVTWVKNRVF